MVLLGLAAIIDTQVDFPIQLAIAALHTHAQPDDYAAFVIATDGRNVEVPLHEAEALVVFM